MKLKITLVLSFFFAITLVYSQEKKYLERELSIAAKSITLYGTLLQPIDSTNNPLVIIIPGSGPTDRDGNNVAMKNNSLKYLAEGLLKNKIASFRYDKSVLSFTKEDKEKIDSLTFDVFVDEAISVINYFQNTKKFSKIFVAGHSQGSLVAILASKNTTDGFISIAGAGRTIDEILLEQIGKNAPFLKEETQQILINLKEGKLVDEFNPMLASLFNKSVQPFLISWIKYNPQEEIKKLTIPTLIINGTKDIQVSSNEAELLHKSNENSELFIVENMNHLFKEIKGDVNENMLSYTNPDLPVMIDLIEIISSFVNK